MVNIHTARTALYRLFDVDGRLLYVGISNMPQARIPQHGYRAWWKDVARKDIEWFDNRQQAAQAEVRAIRTEDPLYNTVQTSRNTHLRR